MKKLHIQASLQALPPRKTAFISLLFGELGTVLISFLVEAITDSQAVGFTVIGLVNYFDKLFWMDKLSKLFSTTQRISTKTITTLYSEVNFYGDRINSSHNTFHKADRPFY